MIYLEFLWHLTFFQMLLHKLSFHPQDSPVRKEMSTNNTVFEATESTKKRRSVRKEVIGRDKKLRSRGQAHEDSTEANLAWERNSFSGQISRGWGAGGEQGGTPKCEKSGIRKWAFTYLSQRRWMSSEDEERNEK